MTQTTPSAGRLCPSATPWGHRPHLDGLRAVAVYLVVAYHAGLSVFEGGFIGVDLFFTLSGYLVTMVLLNDLAAFDRVRLLRFYARRTRRLLPAASLATIGIAVGAVLVLSQLDRARLEGDATASSLWYANWHFIRQASDYFNVDGAESPFIHFWSLAIEEQFYLAFPIVLLAAWRLRPRLSWLMEVTAALALLSVLLQWWTAANDPNTAYLATHTRMYQILAGALLAMGLWRWNAPAAVARRSTTAAATRWASVAAPVLLVLAASSGLGSSVSVRGYIAAGLSVVIIGLLEVSGTSPMKAFFSLRPIRYLGEISYGTYLWHWPLIVLTGVVLDMTPVATFLMAAALGTGLAALSANLVELPIRTWKTLDPRPRATIAGGVATAVLVGAILAPAALASDTRPRIIPVRSTVLAADGTLEETRPLTPVPDLDWRAIQLSQTDVPSCEQTDGSDCFALRREGPVVLLIGDSHARMLLPPLLALGDELDLSIAVAFSPSCPWQNDLIAGQIDDRFSDRCRAARALTYDHQLGSIDPDLVIAAGFPRSTDLGDGARAEVEAWRNLPVAEQVELATRASAAAITERGVPLVIVEPVPILPADQLSCLSAAEFVEECASVPLDEGIEDALARELAAASALIRSVDLDPVLCPSLPTCDAIVDGVVVRRDAHHLTPEFALTLSDEFERTLAPLSD